MHTPAPEPLADTTDVGSLGVFHLKRLWFRAPAARSGGKAHYVAEQQLDRLMIDVLGLGLEQTQQYVVHVRAAPQKSADAHVSG